MNDAGLHERFREAMATVCTPVSVVTTLDDDEPFGTTVSAFTSLSVQPPMVLVALDRGSDLLAAVRRTGRFGLNVLGTDHAMLARTFARKGGTAKFFDIAWERSGDAPRLPGVRSFITCSVARLVDGGDHVVALGDVREAEANSGAPLTYHSRMFGTHVALEEVVR